MLIHMCIYIYVYFIRTIGRCYDCVFLRLGDFWWNLGRCQFLLVVVVVAMSSDLFHRCSLCRTPSSSPCSGGPEVNAQDTSFAVFLDGKQLFYFRMIFSGVWLFLSGQKPSVAGTSGWLPFIFSFFWHQYILGSIHWTNKFQGIAWLWPLFNGIAFMIMMIVPPSKAWRQVSKKNQTTVRRIGRFVIQHASNSRNVLFLCWFWVSNHSRFDF